MNTLKEQMMVEQSGVIPYREDAEGQIEVLLVSRSCGVGWTVPKGGIEPDLSSPRSAAKEAMEEAGVLGMVLGEPVDSFEYEKREQTRRVTLYPMVVTCMLDIWPEMSYRQRQWVPIHEARWLVHRHEMGQVIALLADRLLTAQLPSTLAA